MAKKKFRLADGAGKIKQFKGRPKQRLWKAIIAEILIDCRRRKRRR